MNAKKFLSVLAIASLLALAACDGDSRPFTEAVEVQSLDLSRLDAIPPANSLPPGLSNEVFVNTGQQLQMGLLGTSTSGAIVELSSTGRTWYSTAPTVVGVSDDGLVTALSEGEARAFAVVGGISSTGFKITVRNETLVSISSIEGKSVAESCIPEQYVAYGTFTDSERVLDAVSWSASNESVQLTENADATATITAVSAGSVQLVASVDAISSFPKTVQLSDSLQGIEITPQLGTINVDQVRSYSATGTYIVIDDQGAAIDNSTRQVTITGSVDWTISDGSTFATVVNTGPGKGQVTGTSAGVATLSVACGDDTDLQTITVQQAIGTGNDDSLSFNVDRNILILALSESEELRVSTGSSYAASRDVTEEVSWSYSYDDTGGTAPIDLDLVSPGDEFFTISPVRTGDLDITATRNGRSVTLKIRITN